jgi:hypothetical protein
MIEEAGMDSGWAIDREQVGTTTTNSIGAALIAHKQRAKGIRVDALCMYIFVYIYIVGT